MGADNPPFSICDNVERLSHIGRLNTLKLWREKAGRPASVGAARIRSRRTAVRERASARSTSTGGPASAGENWLETAR